VSESGLSKSGDSQLLEHKGRLHCLKENRLHLLSIFGQTEIIFWLTIIFAPTKH
jgi:hypothetical protein